MIRKNISFEYIKVSRLFFLFHDYYGFELLWSPIRLHFNLFSFRKSCFKANLKTNYRNKQNIVLNIVSIVMSFQWTKKRVKRKIKISCYHCDFAKHTKVWVVWNFNINTSLSLKTSMFNCIYSFSFMKYLRHSNADIL